MIVLNTYKEGTVHPNMKCMLGQAKLSRGCPLGDSHKNIQLRFETRVILKGLI